MTAAERAGVPGGSPGGVPADSGSDVPEIHRPHREAWDTAARLNFGRDGKPNPLLDCAVADFGAAGPGLYTRRVFQRPWARIAGMAFWLLPSLGLRVVSWMPRTDLADGLGLGPLEDYYIDICSASVEGSGWRMLDLYLDIVVWTGERLEVVDEDEFVAATLAGFLPYATAHNALDLSHRAVEGISAHGYDVERWLSEAYGIELTWPDSSTGRPG